jgi:hypothetical protein
MADFSIRSDQVDVEDVMRQIRARIKEKRGVDYTEEEIRELANVKLERFLDPRALRSDLLAHFKSRAPGSLGVPPPTYGFDEETIYASHRAPLRFLRRLLNPLLKLFFNPNPVVQVLHQQAAINEFLLKRSDLESLHFELFHNLVLELTRLGIAVKNLEMRVESLSTRLDFDERRARALEGVVQYRPGAFEKAPAGPADADDGGKTSHAPASEADGVGRPGKRRRRRRGRRRGQGDGGSPAGDESGTASGPAGIPGEPVADHQESGDTDADADSDQ